MKMNTRFIGRLAAACALGAFLAQSAIAAPAKTTSKSTDKAVHAELKSLHKQEREAKTPEERTALRKQMKVKKQQALAAKKTARAAKQGGKHS